MGAKKKVRVIFFLPCIRVNGKFRCILENVSNFTAQKYRDLNNRQTLKVSSNVQRGSLKKVCIYSIHT